jgi:hypothetical protein
MMREVSPSQLRRAAGAELSQSVHEILEHDEWGCAIYRNDRAKFAVSFGNRFSQLPGKYPPSHYGDAVLSEYVMPEPVRPTMVSPVLQHIRNNQPPQISQRRFNVSETLRPEVTITNRTSPTPRPESDPTRYLPHREDEEEVRPAKLEKWW